MKSDSPVLYEEVKVMPEKEAVKAAGVLLFDSIYFEGPLSAAEDIALELLELYAANLLSHQKPSYSEIEGDTRDMSPSITTGNGQ